MGGILETDKIIPFHKTTPVTCQIMSLLQNHLHTVFFPVPPTKYDVTWGALVVLASKPNHKNVP